MSPSRDGFGDDRTPIEKKSAAKAELFRRQAEQAGEALRDVEKRQLAVRTRRGKSEAADRDPNPLLIIRATGAGLLGCGVVAAEFVANLDVGAARVGMLPQDLAYSPERAWIAFALAGGVTFASVGAAHIALDKERPEGLRAVGVLMWLIPPWAFGMYRAGLDPDVQMSMADPTFLSLVVMTAAPVLVLAPIGALLFNRAGGDFNTFIKQVTADMAAKRADHEDFKLDQERRRLMQQRAWLQAQVEDPDGHHGPPPTRAAPQVPNQSTTVKALIGLVTVASLAFVFLMLTGCSGARLEQPHVVVVVDSSSSMNGCGGSACNEDAAVTAFQALEGVTNLHAGTAFDLHYVSDNKTEPPVWGFQVPYVWSGSSPRHAREHWLGERRSQIANLRPNPKPGSSVSLSIWNAATTFSARDANNKVLVIASDLRDHRKDDCSWYLGRAIPTPDAFVECITDSGTKPDLTGVKVVVCGAHAAPEEKSSWTPRMDAALRAAWRAYFDAAGASSLAVFQQCDAGLLARAITKKE